MINMNGTKVLTNVNQSFKLKQWHNIKVINKKQLNHTQKKMQIRYKNDTEKNNIVIQIKNEIIK